MKYASPDPRNPPLLLRSNRCDDFDEGYCHRRQLGEVFLRRNASSTVVLLESESDFDLCIYDRDRADEWPKPIYVARKEDYIEPTGLRNKRERAGAAAER